MRNIKNSPPAASLLAGALLAGWFLAAGPSRPLCASVHEGRPVAQTLRTVVVEVDGRCETRTLAELGKVEAPPVEISVAVGEAAVAQLQKELARRQRARGPGEMLVLIDGPPWALDASTGADTLVLKDAGVLSDVGGRYAGFACLDESSRGENTRFNLAIDGPFVDGGRTCLTVAPASPGGLGASLSSSALFALASLLLCYVAGAVVKEHLQSAARSSGGEQPPLPHAIAKLILRHAPKFLPQQEAVHVASSLGMSADEAASEYTRAERLHP